MSHPLTIELSDVAYQALQLQAHASAQTAAALAAAALEQRFGSPAGRQQQMSDTEKQMARERFEGHFGAVNLGYATGTENEAIDADLARSYADHDQS